MSRIRKYKRRISKRLKKEKTQTKITFLDKLMIVGVTMVFIGLLVGICCYVYYTGGKRAHFHHGREGTVYSPEEAPGEPGHKTTAYIGFVTAGIEGFLLLFSVPTYLISRNHRQEFNRHLKTKP